MMFNKYSKIQSTSLVLKQVCNQEIIKCNSLLIIMKNTKEFVKINTHYIPGVSSFSSSEELFDGKFLFSNNVLEKYLHKCIKKHVYMYMNICNENIWKKYECHQFI